MKIPKKEVFVYSENFKERVILDIIGNRLDYHAAVRKYWGVGRQVGFFFEKSRLGVNPFPQQIPK